MASAVAAVVTPVMNGADWIQDTMMSVLNQTAVRSGRVSLRYVVMDGGSTDSTTDIVRAVGAGAVDLVSERDAGMYDALANALRKIGDGSDVCAYLNAGDLWHERALDVVLDAFQLPGVDWVCGYHVAYNKAGQIIHVRLPFRYRSGLLAAGVYGTSLPSIQQESTFWRGSLLESVDLDRLASFRLAGDYYLWRCMSERATLYTVASLLGGFRLHGDHLSDARASYSAEVATITRRPSPFERVLGYIDRFVWLAPDSVKKALGDGQILRYDLALESWVKGRGRRLPTRHGRERDGS